MALLAAPPFVVAVVARLARAVVLADVCATSLIVSTAPAAATRTNRETNIHRNGAGRFKALLCLTRRLLQRAAAAAAMLLNRSEPKTAMRNSECRFQIQNRNYDMQTVHGLGTDTKPWSELQTSNLETGTKL